MATDFSIDLLNWYDHNSRDLPWRKANPDAYAVWISEIMLQQTTVAAVGPFYERWMARFPTVADVAAAPIDDVLRQWAGLGYYARARNIKKAAEIITESFGGRLPGSVDELLSLPGIGRYTAGAIASIAYDLRAPILDANVTRVLARLFAVPGDPKSNDTKARLWQIAEEVMPHARAGDFNQALMELGALVCLPSGPKCDTCPFAGHCAARALGDPTAFPELSKKKTWLETRHAAALIEENGRILLVHRPEKGLWGGLWELPRAELIEGEGHGEAAARAVLESVGLTPFIGSSFGMVRHVVMNRKITLHGFTATRPIGSEPRAVGCQAFAWAAPEELSRYALSSPQRRLLALWQKSREQPALSFETPLDERGRVTDRKTLAEAR